MSKVYKNRMNSLSEVMNSLKKEGHDLDFTVEKTLELTTTNTDPIERFIEGITLVDTYRFEGMSNPSDTSILYLLKVRDGRTGLLVDSYGAQSSLSVGKFVNQLK